MFFNAGLKDVQNHVMETVFQNQMILRRALQSSAKSCDFESIQVPFQPKTNWSSINFPELDGKKVSNETAGQKTIRKKVSNKKINAFNYFDGYQLYAASNDTFPTYFSLENYKINPPYQSQSSEDEKTFTERCVYKNPRRIPEQVNATHSHSHSHSH